jgi:hypothetical protein
MTSIFVVAAVISIIFLIVKFIEMRFIDKENKPLKFLIRDTLLVYFSVISGHYVLEQLKPVIQAGENVMITSTPQVFTGNPEF